MIAALYVDPAGVYANLPGVEVWDEARDARLYDGPWRVVAHPPCNRWSVMANCRAQRDGEDGGCFEAALASVRKWGGVLEHPANTLAWPTFRLPRPPAYGWASSLLDYGWVCEVDQWHYGHRANKRTWLYFIGIDPPNMRWGRGERGEVRVHDDGGGGRGQRSATPEAFRDALLDLVAPRDKQRATR